MDILDILYTPLDLPPPPEVDTKKLIDWINNHKQELEPFKKYAYDNNISAENNPKIIWPWNMGLVYLNWDENIKPGWICDFDKSFPELSTYMHTVFDIPIEELGSIVILPTKTKHTGMGFWHQDPGEVGLRLYLEFEHIGQNKLFLQKTKLPYDFQQPFELPVNPELLQDEILECKTLTNRYAWYINNTRAFHGTWTEVENSTRIAVIVSGNWTTGPAIIERLKTKILDSALKYKDYAIYWQGVQGSNL